MAPSASTFRATFLPYCLMRQVDGSYIVSNRGYKPVGLTVTDWVEHDAYPVRVHLPEMTEAVARRLDHEGGDSLDEIYLYDDGCVPTDSAEDWMAYSERLLLLAQMRVVAAE